MGMYKYYFIKLPKSCKIYKEKNQKYFYKINFLFKKKNFFILLPKFLGIKIDYLRNSLFFFNYINNKISFNFLNFYKLLFIDTFYCYHYGYQIFMELRGVNYKVFLKGNILYFSLGFNNLLHYVIPENVVVNIIDKKNTKFSLLGKEKNQLIQLSHNLKKYKIPDSYKGKGICYSNEVIKLKVHKKK